MAAYKYFTFLTRTYDAVFDKALAPGTLAPYAGIYHCQNCQWEVLAKRGQRLPLANHHRHIPYSAPTVWRLVAALRPR